MTRPPPTPPRRGNEARPAPGWQLRRSRWERKAEDAGKRARSAEEDKENALSQMRQERRRAKRHLKLEEEANVSAFAASGPGHGQVTCMQAKEEEERREEVDAIAARRKAEVELAPATSVGDHGVGVGCT
eukprot:512550-Hanusia_phi.AAC.4